MEVKNKDKDVYVTPEVEVIEVKTEGIVCASGEDMEWL